MEIATHPPQPPGLNRRVLIARAFRLEGFTVAWMTVEAGVAIGSGYRAHSLSLTAFGVDSLIELASAGVLVWRLSAELRHGRGFSGTAEGIAGRAAGGLLFALALCVAMGAAWGLWSRRGEAFSWAGMGVTALAIPVMYGLARRKLAVAERLGSRALRADAVEAIACGWLSFVVMIGLAAQRVMAFWWIDSVASLAILWLLVKEGSEAWQGVDCCGQLG